MLLLMITGRSCPLVSLDLIQEQLFREEFG